MSFEDDEYWASAEAWLTESSLDQAGPDRADRDRSSRHGPSDPRWAPGADRWAPPSARGPYEEPPAYGPADELAARRRRRADPGARDVYVGDRYLDDRPLDDRQVDDRYLLDGRRPRDPYPDDRYLDDRYLDDRYVDGRYFDDGYLGDPYLDDPYLGGPYASTGYGVDGSPGPAWWRADEDAEAADHRDPDERDSGHRASHDAYRRPPGSPAGTGTGSPNRTVTGRARVPGPRTENPWTDRNVGAAGAYDSGPATSWPDAGPVPRPAAARHREDAPPAARPDLRRDSLPGARAADDSPGRPGRRSDDAGYRPATARDPIDDRRGDPRPVPSSDAPKVISRNEAPAAPRVVSRTTPPAAPRVISAAPQNVVPRAVTPAPPPTVAAVNRAAPAAPAKVVPPAPAVPPARVVRQEPTPQPRISPPTVRPIASPLPAARLHDSRSPDSRPPDSRPPDSRPPDSRSPDSRPPDSWLPAAGHVTSDHLPNAVAGHPADTAATAHRADTTAGYPATGSARTGYAATPVPAGTGPAIPGPSWFPPPETGAADGAQIIPLHGARVPGGMGAAPAARTGDVGPVGDVGTVGDTDGGQDRAVALFRAVDRLDTTAPDRPDRPAADRPVTDRPAADRPAADRRASDRPATGWATTGWATTGWATTDRATSDRATTDHASNDHATTDGAATESAATNQATTGQATGRATTDRAVTDRATTDRATTDRATTDRATTDQATTDHATTDRAVTDRATTSDVPVTDILLGVLAPDSLLPAALLPGPEPTEQPPAPEPEPDPVAEPEPEPEPEPPTAEEEFAAIRWRLDGATLREVVDDRDALRALGARLDQPLTEAKDDTSQARLLCLRAVVYRLLGELGMAAAASRLAVTRAESSGDPDSVVIAQAELAHVLRLRGDFAEADRLFEEAASAEVPGLLRCAVHENAGRSCFDQGRHMEAMDHFTRAIRLGDPEDLDLVQRIEVALEAVYIRVLRDGWGPYPRLRREILEPGNIWTSDS